jgi:uncharacterized protein (UPF0212 family)
VTGANMWAPFQLKRLSSASVISMERAPVTHQMPKLPHAEISLGADVCPQCGKPLTKSTSHSKIPRVIDLAKSCRAL